MGFYMGIEGEESESATKFDHLVSAKSLQLGSNSLSRVPSVKNMPHLHSLALQSNKITMIAPGDLFGAESLVYFDIGNNLIESVAPEAFANIVSLRVAPETFNPSSDDGTPPQLAYGVGACYSTQPFYRFEHSPLSLYVQYCCNCDRHATALPSIIIASALLLRPHCILYYQTQPKAPCGRNVLDFTAVQ